MEQTTFSQQIMGSLQGAPGHDTAAFAGLQVSDGLSQAALNQAFFAILTHGDAAQITG
ncbi:MAG: hypothetical protein K9G71_16775 [Rhodobacteraceae bacterium]|nr:hypothetical protein [Paracoccaceae bacterium]MCF8515909.1 hypothetical protein [Paracoccaceae bacterium]MCF8520323.1 hypothetical protein [Paracoccaceae bacterium]